MTESKRISDLFDRYKNRLRAPQKTVTTIAQQIIAQSIGITLTDKQISYTPATRILYINAPSILKTEIKTREPHIISELQKALGTRSAPNTIL